MNEEEKKAVEKFRKLGVKKFREEKIKNEDLLSYIEYVVILNLIEKLQKENEDLRRSNKKLYEIGQEMCKQDKYASENFIPIQKVKEKIEENEWAIEGYDCAEADYKQSQAIGAWSVLQELIEEREDK